MKSRPLAIFFGGPDGCGKTEISTELAKELCLPRFKAPNELNNWTNRNFHNSLYFDAILPDFAEQTGTSFISDRSYACEWVYSQIYRPETYDEKNLRLVDNKWADENKFKAVHVILQRRDYSTARADELVKNHELNDIANKYNEFTEWTGLPSLTVFVDQFMLPDGSYDIQAQLRFLIKSIDGVVGAKQEL